MATDTIVRAAIHPGIGIARVGNSDEYFIGPEVPYPTSAPAGFYKDEAGALKRQAARFRIYGYTADGEIVQEITADDADIEWTVHVANKKAAWYNFEVALDIPEAVPCLRRNAKFTHEERHQLVIDPGPRSVQGAGQQGPAFDSGEFFGQKVYLGELHTDEKGRLLFLGGRGVSSSPFPNNTPYTFGNNDGWHDDTSDGPVQATVTIGGQSIPVDPAWVVVGPPNYAPDIISVQTMYDVLYDTYQKVWIAPITKPSFTEHIYPILQEFCDAQWVNYGFHVQFGWRSPYDFLQPDYLARLKSQDNYRDKKDVYQEDRIQLFNIFRDPSSKVLDVDGWPQMYGDDVTIPPTGPRALLALTQTQYNFLKQWAAGNFIADWDQRVPPPERIEDAPLAEQPATLDKAALHFCLGGPFHPGCEMTWPMRRKTMYCAPFRIRPRAADEPEMDYGPVLTPQVAMSELGPLYANGPGDITRWMAVPWQTDTASCRAGYQSSYDPYIPTFWPARVPNHVLAEEEYNAVINSSDPEERMLAFNTRSTWYRFLEGGTLAQINQMITDFGKLGVLERRDGPENDSQFPPVMYVESQVGFAHQPPLDRNTVIGAVEKVTRHSPTQFQGEPSAGEESLPLAGLRSIT